MAYHDFISSVHNKTRRDYLGRVNEFPKAEAAGIATEVREEDLEGHFTQEEALPDPDEAADPEEGAAAGLDEDVQLARALEVLKSWTYFDRLRKARGEYGPIRSAEAASDAPAP